MDRRRNPSASLHKRIAGELIHRHDRCITKQSAKLNNLANTLTDNRDQTYSCCFLVYHTNSSLICNNTCNGRSLGISRNCDHIKTYRTYTGHGLQLLKSQSTCIYSIDHTLILTDRNKRTAQTANCSRSHNTTFFHLVI